MPIAKFELVVKKPLLYQLCHSHNSHVKDKKATWNEMQNIRKKTEMRMNYLFLRSPSIKNSLTSISKQWDKSESN